MKKNKKSRLAFVCAGRSVGAGAEHLHCSLMSEHVFKTPFYKVTHGPVNLILSFVFIKNKLTGLWVN